ncbi:MAG TPA: lipid II flippase MurJ [Actinotalea sp.]|nr:lipid II flippase MurJ [Actinotalea sp.]
MIALVNVASRVVGFLRWLVMADAVGPNALGSAYTSANALPNVMFEVAAGGALAGAVVPLLAVPLARSMRGDVDRTASALLGWAMLVLVPIAVVVALLAEPLVGLFLGDATAGEQEVAGTFLVTFAPQIPLYGIGVVLAGVLQAQRRFLAAALAPLLNSLVVIAVFLLFDQMVTSGKDDPASIADSAILLLGWGTTAGVAVMSLSLVWPVHRTGVRVRLTLGFPPGVAVTARSLALAGLGALVAQQASVLVTMALANGYGQDGTYPVFLYTQAVYFLPYAVLAYPLATASLPRLAERAARQDRQGFARLAAGTTRTLLLVSGVGVAGLVAVAPAVEQVFAPIADGSVAGMATGLTWMAPGLLGFALILHLSRALYTLHRGRTAVLATASGWLVVAGAAALLVPRLTGGGQDQVATLQGLGAATTIGMSVAGVGLLVGTVRAAGRASALGMTRTGLALVVGVVAGAWAGRASAALVLGPAGEAGLPQVLLAGLTGGVVATAVVLAVSLLVDPTAVRALRGRSAVDAPTGEPGDDPAHATADTPADTPGDGGPDRSVR